jgi:hypothetical protein
VVASVRCCCIDSSLASFRSSADSSYAWSPSSEGVYLSKTIWPEFLQEKFLASPALWWQHRIDRVIYAAVTGTNEESNQRLSGARWKGSHARSALVSRAPIIKHLLP